MKIQEKMEAFMTEIGLWEDARRKFVLPAGPHLLDASNVETIKRLGVSIINFVKIADQLMHTAVEKNLGSGGMEIFRNVATAGISKIRRKHQRLFPRAFPATTKVDFIKGIDGEMYIVEIDTTNTHGLGYGKILKTLENFLGHGHLGFVGTESVLNHSPLSVIVPFNDRFHEGEWNSTAELIDTLEVYSERKSRPQDFSGRTILDIHHRLEKGYQEKLVEMAASGELKILVPPKDKLESKNILPLIWDEKTGEILLREGLSPEDREMLKLHIPKSLFTNKKTVWQDYSDEEWLVKEVFSNAMKGVFKPSYIKDCPGDLEHILQEKILQKEQEFEFFGDNGKKSAKLFSRYVVYFDKNGSPLECLYTATDEELTHGGVGAVMGACSFQ